MKDKTGLWVSPRHFGGLHQCHWEVIHCGHTTKLGVFLSGVTTWWMNKSLLGRMVRLVKRNLQQKLNM